MATSGSIDYSLTAREVIDFALKKLRVLASGETASAAQATDAMRELNMMLKGWQKHQSLWRLTEGEQSIVANTANYTLSSTNPYRLISARYYNGTTETPMARLTREEYYDLPLKTSTGTPTQFYVDRQRTTTVLYIWPLLASVSSETVKYTYQRKFEDVDSLDNEIDVRQEHLEVVGYNLAARLADNAGRTGEVVNRIIGRAEMLLNEALDDDREPFVRFIPDYEGMA